MNKAFIFGLMLVLVAGLVNAAANWPPPPQAFYGTVTVNGAPAADGITVTATVDGVTAEQGTTHDGKYGYDAQFLIDDPDNNRAGKTIKFYVNGYDTGQTAIVPDFNDELPPLPTVELDLSVTYSTGGGNSGGSGGGGGGGGGGGSLPPADLWDCGEWSECVDGIQTQECIQGDATKTNTRDCEEESASTTTTGTTQEAGEEPVLAGPAPPKSETGPTGAVVSPKGKRSAPLLILTIALLVAALVLLFLSMKGKGKK